MKKKNQKKNFQLLILFFLILFLVDKTNFPRAMYDVFLLNYEDRMLKRHDFCEKTGYGYIPFLKKNYNIEKLNPKIINYRPYSPKYWLYQDTLKTTNSDYKILLNFISSHKQIFQKSYDRFVSKEAHFGLNFLEKVQFIFDDNQYNIENQNGIITIFNQKQGNLIPIINVKLGEFEKINNQIYLNIENERLNRVRKNSLSLDPGELVLKVNLGNKVVQDNLSTIVLHFSRKNDILNHKILHNTGNCYFIKKND